MSKDLMTVIAHTGGALTEPKECSCVYIDAGKIRLAVHYDPIKKCLTMRSTTGHRVAIIPESNNSYHVRSM